MTKLCEVIMEVRAIQGMEKLVLYGWAAQLEEGNDAVYASKATVAKFIGVSEDTVQRKTKTLVKDGWLIEMGEHKQWQFARTPVRTINIPVIVGLWEAQCLWPEKAPPQSAVLPEAPPQIAPPQIAAQGSGAIVLTSSFFTSPGGGGAVSASSGPPLPSVGRKRKSKDGETLKPENLKTVEPNPSPVPHGPRSASRKKSCPKCNEPLQRDVNHLLVCRGNGGDEEMDELDEMEAAFLRDRDQLYAEEAQQAEEEAILWREGTKEDGAVTPMPPFPHSAAPTTSLASVQHPCSKIATCVFCAKFPCRSPRSDYCIDCWNERQRTGLIPKLAEEIRPSGISS